MKYIFGILLLILAALIIVIFQLPDNNLHIIACDVGQGDAILITYKNIQILTDGGPDNKVTNCLSRYMPFWDRKIELVISTHPDADHSTGLIEVLKRYKVDNIMINPIDSGTPTIKALENQVGSHGIPITHPVEGMGIGVGLIRLDIVSPSQDLVNGLTDKIEGNKLGFFTPLEGTNVYSIVYRLDFGNFKALFPGDINSSVSDRLASENKIGTVNYIKIPHHGSNDGLTENLLKALMPKMAIISVGKNNLFGHPTPQIIKMLTEQNIKIYRTDEVGDVEVITNGNEFWVKK